MPQRGIEIVRGALAAVRDGKITRFRFFQSKEDALAVVEVGESADM
jgi:hypothetical protein